MKRVRIYPYKIGFVYREGNFIKALPEGMHWLWWNDEVVIHDMTTQLYTSIDLNILLEDKVLADLLDVVEVLDHEIGLLYRKGIFDSVLTAGKHAFWKSIVTFQARIIDLNDYEVAPDIDRKILTRPDVIYYLRVFKVESYEQGILFVDGKFVKALEADVYYFWKNENSISIEKMDKRLQQMEISGQEILTKDKAALRINFFAQYRITEIVKALLQTKDFNKQLYIVLQLGIREYVGTLTLDELLARKETAQKFILEMVAEQLKELGVEISACGIRDIILPGEIKTIMNQVLVAEKRAQANIITRREETASTRSLLNTAKLMEDNEMLFKLKEMEYVEKIAERIGEITVSGGGKVVDELKSLFSGQR